MIALTVNGERRELPEGSTVETAAAEAGAPSGGHGVAVAVDGEVVPRGEWAATRLAEGQEVEVLHAVQGG